MDLFSMSYLMHTSMCQRAPELWHVVFFPDDSRSSLSSVAAVLPAWLFLVMVMEGISLEDCTDLHLYRPPTRVKIWFWDFSVGSWFWFLNRLVKNCYVQKKMLSRQKPYLPIFSFLEVRVEWLCSCGAAILVRLSFLKSSMLSVCVVHFSACRFYTSYFFGKFISINSCNLL